MNKREYSSGRIVFLLDVDNTLLDNDGVQADLRGHLIDNVGRKRAKEYWRMFELLRAELGYAEYLGALQLYRAEYPRDPHLLTVSQFLVEYTFADRLFPKALKVIARLRRWRFAVILSDGDVVFQPLKINRSGLADAVSGRVLIYVHKEQELEDVEQRYPAEHYAPQIACFDTAFHNGMPRVAKLLPDSAPLQEQGRETLRLPRLVVRVFRDATAYVGPCHPCSSRQWRESRRASW